MTALLRTLRAFSISTACLITFIPTARADSAYRVQIDTPGFALSAGSISGRIAFDFIDGDHASADNVLTVAGFGTDGSLTPGPGLNSTGATGDLPNFVTLTDAELYNQSQHEIAFNSSISFYVTATENFTEPGAPDRYSASLLVANGLPFPTDDPSGANTLFTLDIDGSPGGRPTVYHSKLFGVTCTVTPVPLSSVPKASYIFSLPVRPDLTFTLSQGNPPVLKIDQVTGSGPSATHQTLTMPISTMQGAGSILKVEVLNGQVFVTTTQGVYISPDGFQYIKVG